MAKNDNMVKDENTHRKPANIALKTINNNEIDKDWGASYSHDLAQLTQTQKAVLKAIVEDFLSGSKQTDEAISQSLCVDRTTIYRCRQHPVFTRVLAAMCKDIVRSRTNKTLNNIEKAAEKDWRASKFLLELTGEYVQTSRTQNLNVNVNTQPNSPAQYFVMLVQQLKATGYTLDRAIEELTAAWNEI